MLRLAGDMARTAQEMRDTAGGEQMKRLAQIKASLQGSESHYLREENVLFPYLERHGITQPPAIMWMEHDRIRAAKKELYALVESAGGKNLQEHLRRLREQAVGLGELLNDHFTKENRVLFQTAMQVMTRAEWAEARQQFDELGYCPFTPEAARAPYGEPVQAATRPAAAGEVILETGVLPKAELEAMLNALPVEITFVDADDTVRYFNQPQERLFTRTKAAIGRKVQLCHPQKSLDKVNRIVQDFRNGRRDVAEFWIQPKSGTGQDMFVHIRFFAVRDRTGKYLGALEVVQDLTHLRMLQGERRLIDETE